VKIIFSEKCLEYDFPGHPESPRRVQSAYNLLKKKNFKFIEPKPAQEKDLLRAHTKSMIEKVKAGGFLDADTPSSKKMFEYALLSCGAAILAQEIALNNEPAFSLMRPPGHHATKDSSGGFCYFNNIAVAVHKALESIKRAAIIDIDCHHGNGTQDIFLGDKRVLYISLHQSPFYPGTGLTSENNCLNFPLAAGSGGEEYLNVLKKAVSEAEKFNPQLIAVSAGFDTYKDDPLTNLNLEKTTYAEISKLILSLNKPVFSVLEGGYSAELARCIEQYLLE
jgi:acetoin utilization deacetylase AcuC-like enzyme